MGSLFFIQRLLKSVLSVDRNIQNYKNMSCRNRLLGSSKHSKKQSDESNASLIFESDSTQLLTTLKQTDLMGILSVLYGLLLHGAPERPTTLRSVSVSNNLSTMTSSVPKVITEHTLSVAFAVLSVLNALAETNLPLLQVSYEDFWSFALSFTFFCFPPG